MKTVSQNLSRMTHQIVAQKVHASLQQGDILAIIEDQTHKQVAAALNAQLEQELSDALDRQPYQRGEGPLRNGYRKTRVLGFTGQMDLQRPVLRTATPKSPLLVSLKRAGQGLIGFLATRFWLRGASTRAVAQEINSAFGTRMRSQDVSHLTDALMPEINAWLKRPVPTNIRYLYLDAMYLPAKKLGFTTKQALLAALGVDSKGHVHVLGFLFGDRENNDTWTAFLRDLLNRGLDRKFLRMVISDDHKAIVSCVASELAVPHQICLVHKLRNVRARVASRDRKAFLADFKAVYWAGNRDEANRALGALKARWEKRYPKAVETTEANWEACLTFMNEPRALWTTLRSSNIIERFNRELRRRFKPAGAMMSENEVWKLAWSVSTEQETRWQRRRVHGAKNVDLTLKVAA